MDKYNTIIWDLDGTLADTSEGIYNSIRYVQQKMNLPQITNEQMRSHIGPPIQESYVRNFNLSGLKLEKAIQYHKEYANEKGLYEVQLYPGIIDLLELLRKKQCKQAVVTLKFEETAKKMLDYLNISCYFEFIYGTCPRLYLPKSEMIKKSIDIINSEKEKVLLIGDSFYDAIGASQAEIDFLPVTYGFGFLNKEDLKDYSHIGHCESAEKISDFLVCENKKMI